MNSQTTVFLRKDGRAQQKRLYELVIQGTAKRYPTREGTAGVVDRIVEELHQISEGSCADYFLMVHDYVSWAKNQGILLSPGVFAAPSSLVCYCLGITEVNPMENGLIFERFYHSGKKLSIAVGVDLSQKDRLVEFIAGKYDQLLVAVASPEDEDYMKLLDDPSIMSFPIVGMDILTKLNDAQKEGSFSLWKIPENDRFTYEMISSMGGIYQLESPEIREYMKRIPELDFDDLVALTSMNRLGSERCIPRYIDVSNGTAEPTFPDEALEDILRPTNGIIVYREQLMDIIHDYAGLDYREADDICKIMRLRRIGKNPGLRETFVDAAKRLGHDGESAEKVFDLLYRIALFTLPKSHAICEARLTYWHAYIRCHYPETGV